MNPITIETLEVIDAIDRRGSFAKAAEELNKATSALSYGVQKLEEQLDIALFRRQGRRSVLTPAGRLVLEDGRKILQAARQLADRAKEVATGWEPRLRIALESTLDRTRFLQLLNNFLLQHPSLELDVCESVLNGGWDALEQGRVDLVVGAPGPVPLQKGFRALVLGHNDMLPVIAAEHPMAALASDSQALEQALPKLRRVITHDTSTAGPARSAGLDLGQQTLYVQTMDQKIEAQLAGLGIGYLPRHRIQHYLNDGRLLELALPRSENEIFLAWKIDNKGKALQALTQQLSAQPW